MEEAFRDRGARFLAYYHRSEDLSFFDSLDRNVVSPIIWLARAEDLANVRLKWIPTQGYWLVDQLVSPVVELTRGRSGPSLADAVGFTSTRATTTLMGSSERSLKASSTGLPAC